MRVYFINHKNDADFDTDYVFIKEIEFFVDVEKAEKACIARNDTNQLSWSISYLRNREKWEKADVAYQALIDMGIDPKDGMPYHKREFKDDAFVEGWFIDSIEVEE